MNQSQYVYQNKKKQLAIENVDSSDDDKFTTPKKNSMIKQERQKSNTESREASIVLETANSDDDSEYIEIQDSSIQSKDLII